MSDKGISGRDMEPHLLNSEEEEDELEEEEVEKDENNGDVEDFPGRWKLK
jgi:hypothetical protein